MSYLVFPDFRYDKRKPLEINVSKDFTLAGAEGLEPSTKVLETHVLPLHHAPTGFVPWHRDYYTWRGQKCQ